MAEFKLRDLSMNFAVDVLKLCDSIKGHFSLTNQLERSATSIGANNHEANYAQSKADSWEEIVPMMYDKGLDSRSDEIVRVVYNPEHSERFIIMKSEHGYYKYVYETLTEYDAVGDYEEMLTSYLQYKNCGGRQSDLRYKRKCRGQPARLQNRQHSM